MAKTRTVGAFQTSSFIGWRRSSRRYRGRAAAEINLLSLSNFTCVTSAPAPELCAQDAPRTLSHRRRSLFLRYGQVFCALLPVPPRRTSTTLPSAAPGRVVGRAAVMTLKARADEGVLTYARAFNSQNSHFVPSGPLPERTK